MRGCKVEAVERGSVIYTDSRPEAESEFKSLEDASDSRRPGSLAVVSRYFLPSGVHLTSPALMLMFGANNLQDLITSRPEDFAFAFHQNLYRIGEQACVGTLEIPVMEKSADRIDKPKAEDGGEVHFSNLKLPIHLIQRLKFRGTDGLFFSPQSSSIGTFLWVLGTSSMDAITYGGMFANSVNRNVIGQLSNFENAMLGLKPKNFSGISEYDIYTGKWEVIPEDSSTNSGPSDLFPPFAPTDNPTPKPVSWAR